MNDSEKSIALVGTSESLAMFSLDNKAVIIDLSTNLVVDSGTYAEVYTSDTWSEKSIDDLPPVTVELAESALTDLNISILTAGGGRLYTIPKGAQAEAKKALEWRKENKRGGTPVGLNTARTLARGGQIGIEKVRHIAKYFPRHEVDKQGKGWAPGQDNFPSNGRIAWALWGGDVAWRWAAAIVERENKKARTASGISGPELESFNKAMYLDPMHAPEFMVRVRLDGSGIDRLYKIDLDGAVYVWDDGCWDSLGYVDGDIWTYDKALDDPYDTVEKTHIPIDPESAIVVAAKYHQDSFKHISITEIDDEEAQLVALAANDLDWEIIDYTMTAAAGINPEDNVYSPEERSQNATKQLRNALGRFAQTGQRVVIDGNSSKSGTITKTNSDGTVEVTDDQGNVSVVPAKSTQPEGTEDKLPSTDFQRPLDVSGILGEPRTPINQPYAQMPKTLPSMTKDDLHDVLYNWAGWVQSQRSAGLAKGLQSSGEEKEAEKEEPEAYNHPLLNKWRKGLEETKDPDSGLEWASPVVAAPVAATKEDKKAYKMTPETSDVQPLYMAIVAEDDPRAVLDLVAIVPASSTSTDPMTYKREKGKWVRDESILKDFKSATPPPVIPLTSEVLNDVLLQVDDATMTASAAFSADQLLMILWGPREDIAERYSAEFIENLDKNMTFDENFKAVFALAAAGGLDRNRGNAEKLRRYWTRGKGAAKIRWGTHGDWRRCVRHLGKYMGVRAKGYCQLRHKEVNAFYTGDKRNHSIHEFMMEEVWGENIGRPTHVTDEDMLMPLDKIMTEPDDLYDAEWVPAKPIVEAMEDLAELSDEYFESIVAAGGMDRNSGQAEKLRRYWTVGKGAAKVRWGTGGDWSRCVRHLTKYMGPRSKGYCSLRHKEMTGTWTGDRRHRALYGRKNGKPSLFSTEYINSTSQVLIAATMNAQMQEAKERVAMVASGEDGLGAKFYIPLLIPEGIESGDGRKFKRGSIEMRELPLPLLWQIKTANGHDGSVVVGKIERLERTDKGLGNAYGVLDTGAYAKEVERLIRNGFIRGISADMDQFEATEDKPDFSEEEYAKKDKNKDKPISKSKITINKARVMAATIVSKPAFQECSISLIDESPLPYQEDNMIPDGIYVDDADAADAQALVACGIVAGAIPVTPPSEWFENPKLKKATPLTVDDMGRVFGHIAAWDVDHIGMSYGTKPPRSRSKYAYFHTGVVRTDAGTDVPVGQLTLAGGHASLEASAMDAVKHYDDTGSAIADVHAGEDAYGIWVAGALRPSASPEQIRALRASAPSGDWRPIRGGLELVAVCQVNVPGFPIARARVASGAVMALVAAGAATLAKLKADPIAEMSARIEKLEKITTPKEELEARVASLKAKVDEAKTEFAYISRDEREKLAKKGQALPDGSYPIRDVEDLKNAIQAYGRSKKSDRPEVRKHIMKRAHQLNYRHLIPENWKTASSDAVTASAEKLRAKLAAIQEATFANKEEIVKEIIEKAPAVVDEVIAEDIDTPKEQPTEDRAKFIPGKNQPRDVQGRFRDVLARLKDDLGTAGLQDVVDEVKKVENITGLGNYEEAAQAGQNLLNLLNRLDEGSLNNVSLENVRKTAAELGKVISNLPLPFTNQAQKVRYSDLPPALRNLMETMVERVEKKIGKKDANIATKELKSFMSGSELYSQSDISSQMARMLRLLT